MLKDKHEMLISGDIVINAHIFFLPSDRKLLLYIVVIIKRLLCVRDLYIHIPGKSVLSL